ncbi:MAG: Uma2 family endonuclease, partial [Ktedonobacteraceae bacterium]
MAMKWTRGMKSSVQEFFELIERDPEARYEYVDGEVYMMTGGKPGHAAIGNNIGSILHNLLRSR